MSAVDATVTDGVAGLQSHRGVTADAAREREGSTPPRRRVGGR